MECIQRNKNGEKCKKPAKPDPDYEGYCKYHTTRFRAGNDNPNPVQNIEGGNQVIPPAPARPPQIQRQRNPLENQLNQIFNVEFMDLVNMDIDERLNIFLRAHHDDLVIPSIGNRVQNQEALLFQIIEHLPQEEQDFLVLHYERLFELLNVEINRIQRARVAGEPERVVPLVIPPRNQINLIGRLLQAIGFREEEAFPLENLRQRPEGDLERLANDKQNVHTTKVVQMVLDTSKKLIKIAKKKSPDLDTMAYCFTKCKLTDKARQQMALMYYSDISIYDLKAPTYRLVLDGVWVFINSRTKELQDEIVGRLSQELEDNVGMCPQGNLSRLVNVLSGYMDGVGFKLEKSIQDLMLELKEIKNKEKRKVMCEKLCKDYKQSEEEKKAWLEALLEE